MKIQFPARQAACQRGITLVELLLVISLLVILVAFALPSAGNATARADLHVAVENLEHSIATARNVARLTESSIALTIESATDETSQRITFGRPPHYQGTKGPDIPEYMLPEGIALISNQDSYVFDKRGLVEQPGRLVLVSRNNDAISSSLEIN
jgi:prepilin-type N-terminal cleavage/methylation domain-containing protein